LTPVWTLELLAWTLARMALTQARKAAPPALKPARALPAWALALRVSRRAG